VPVPIANCIEARYTCRLHENAFKRMVQGILSAPLLYSLAKKIDNISYRTGVQLPGKVVTPGCLSEEWLHPGQLPQGLSR